MASTKPNPNTTTHLNPALPRLDTPLPPRHSYYMNGRVFTVAGIILITIVFFIVAFHVYARLLWRRRHSLASWHRNLGSHDALLTGGLGKAIVDSLPTFTYTVPLLPGGGNVVPKEAGTGFVECAVCLIEFEENDACRLLPKCNHSFHTECIDRWFLSNTTCPLCRTSAEPVDSDDACRAEISSAFGSPRQEHGDHVSTSDSSPSECLLPHQDSCSHIQRQDVNIRMQRSRSSSPLAVELEGGGLHVRRMLARTCSGRADARYDLEGGNIRNDTIRESMRIERSGNMARDGSQRNHGGEAFVQHLHLPNWQRSVSDRCLGGRRQGMQFPSNVLFWGNQSHVDSRLNTDRWQVGGQSLPHIAIDVPKPQGSILTSHSALSSPSQCISTCERPYALSTSVQRQPSRMNSLRSEERTLALAEHEMS